MLKRERLSERNSAGPLFILYAAFSFFMGLSESEGGKRGVGIMRIDIQFPFHGTMHPATPRKKILGFVLNRYIT